MTATEATEVTATEPNAEGYREFTLGGFTFRRDEFFAHITWPTGSHILSVDNFLRALQRDVAWDFFYGTVNFDGVFGTVNHYGTVDMFAGRYNDAYRKAELDHLENFETPLIRETFKALLDDWTNEGFDPFASPAETAKPFGVKRGNNTPAITRHRVTAQLLPSHHQANGPTLPRQVAPPDLALGPADRDRHLLALVAVQHRDCVLFAALSAGIGDQSQATAGEPMHWRAQDHP